jgi:hypothetical protein
MAPPESARSWVLVPHALNTRSDMVAAKAMRFIIVSYAIGACPGEAAARRPHDPKRLAQDIAWNSFEDQI